MKPRFSRFQRLPPEIRNMIWDFACPDPRVFEVLDAPNAKQRTPAQQGLMFANLHSEPPPALASVCQESRSLVMYKYKPLTLGSTTKFVDLSQDLLLLEPYLLVKRLHRTLRFMSQIPLLRGSLTRIAMGTSYGVYTGVYHPVLSWKLAKNNLGKLLQRLEDFTKLRSIVFVVYQEFQFDFNTRPQLPMGAYASEAAVQGIAPIPISRPPSIPSMPMLPSPTPLALTPATLPPLLPFVGLPTPPATPSPPRLCSPPLTNVAPYTPLGLPSLHTPAQTFSVLPRPQVIHQAYRFKFDIETSLNHRRRRPHVNEILYYPRETEEDGSKRESGIGPNLSSASAYDSGASCWWEQQQSIEDAEWCEPWPTDQEWRRFRGRFQRAVDHTLDMGVAEEEDHLIVGQAIGGKACAQAVASPIKLDRSKVPRFEGASLVWRYKQGGYI